MLTQSSEIETDGLLENLRRASGLEALRADLAKYREVLVALASMPVNAAFTERLREKIRAVDVLLGLESNGGAPTGPDASGRATDLPSSGGSGSQTQQVRKFSPDRPPDLRHTRVLFSRFGNKAASGWNNLVHVAHIEALGRLKSVDALRAASTSNVIKGRAGSEETKKGYRYVPEIDVSIQNVDAAHALSNALRLARHLQVELTVDFEWMDKAEAAYPGTKGRLEWKP